MIAGVLIVKFGGSTAGGRTAVPPKAARTVAPPKAARTVAPPKAARTAVPTVAAHPLAELSSCQETFHDKKLPFRETEDQARQQGGPVRRPEGILRAAGSASRWRVGFFLAAGRLRRGAGVYGYRRRGGIARSAAQGFARGRRRPV